MKTYIEYIRTHLRNRAQLFLLALLGLTPVYITSCSNPSSSPETSTATADYSAQAFFNTTTLGDTTDARKPFPPGFPADFIKEKLGLTDDQMISIKALQDSLCAAMKVQIDAMKAAGTVDPAAVKALREQFQAQLEAGLATILTADQLATLKALAPPDCRGEDGRGGRGPKDGRGPRDGKPHVGPDSLEQALTPAAMDSLVLAQMTDMLAKENLALTADQIVQIQALQAKLHADATVTPEQFRPQFKAGMQTILTADQLAKLKEFGDRGDRGRKERHGHR